MTQRSLRLFSAAALTVGVSTAYAQLASTPTSSPLMKVTLAQAPESAQSDPGMLLALQKLYPTTTFKSVIRTAVPGIFEVTMGTNVAYVDQTGRYFFFGHMYDMPGQKDLTASKLEDANKIDVATLPLADAIKVVKGDGSKRTLYLFSDPDCPFCKQLEQNMAGLTDLTIYTFLFPLEGLHPQAKQRAVAIWCSQDRAKAWDAYMHQGTVPTSLPCDNPVERNIALGQKFGVTGTPTLIAGDGRKMPGAAPAERIAQWLDAGAARSTAQ